MNPNRKPDWMPVFSIMNSSSLFRWTWIAGWLAVVASASHAAVGPRYVRPTNDIPTAYKDTNVGSWQVANPADAAPRDDWWRWFQDETLNQWVAQVDQANQDLQAALARVEQARAGARQAKSEYFPSLSFDPNYNRNRYSPNAPLIFPIRHAHDIRVPFDLSYELDLWGRVRRAFESARLDADARAAAFQSLRLALISETVQLYFSLRATDAELAIVSRTLDLWREQLQLIQSRAKAGAASELDVSRLQTEVSSVAADFAAVKRKRQELITALAVLVGRPASAFEWSAMPLPLDAMPPLVPAGLPSELLERRPDIAEAERDLAARNARIGVAKAAFFPTVRLTGTAGWESADVDSLFNWESRIWSLGPSITLPIFQGARNRAQLRRAQAAWDEGVALYRQRVLVAFKEVQDALTASRLLSEQSAAQTEAVEAARRTAELSKVRYNAGFVSSLEVVDSSRTALTAERQSAQLAGQRFVTAVQLIKALGGGWSVVPPRAVEPAKKTASVGEPLYRPPSFKSLAN